jgi:AraC family transcriptional regulator of adaptative response/methylated-DNA-[protein]-cysteine methyltransferase
MRETIDNAANEKRWTVLVSRDHGPFVYGVKTTGVYCRPSCRSRKPRRENVEFFDSQLAAEKAGYRACQRCRPNQPEQVSHVDLVLEACRRIEASQEKLSLADLASAAGLSKFHFQRIFKSIVGVSPKQYAVASRFDRFRADLGTSASVTAAIHKAGFNSTSRAFEASARSLGMSPRNFRAGGRGLCIRYGTAKTELGLMLVAATDRGVCAIAFGDERAALVYDVKRSFPSATLTAGGADFDSYLQKVAQFVQQPSHCLDLPLDIKGTAFQQRVWQALRNIPAGKTISYSELAKRIGRPKAVRAVASACAANKLAVAVPCHRVINSKGGISGYRWGKARKAKLLQREQRSSL